MSCCVPLSSPSPEVCKERLDVREGTSLSRGVPKTRKMVSITREPLRNRDFQDPSLLLIQQIPV